MASEAESTNRADEPELSHGSDLPLISATPKTSKPPRGSLPGGMVEEVLSMFAHSGSFRDPLLDKISPKQIDRAIEIRAKQQEYDHELRLRRQRTSQQ